MRRRGRAIIPMYDIVDVSESLSPPVGVAKATPEDLFCCVLGRSPNDFAHTLIWDMLYPKTWVESRSAGDSPALLDLVCV